MGFLVDMGVRDLGNVTLYIMPRRSISDARHLGRGTPWGRPSTSLGRELMHPAVNWCKPFGAAGREDGVDTGTTS
jgi:hypothetical protein